MRSLILLSSLLFFHSCNQKQGDLMTVSSEVREVSNDLYAELNTDQVIDVIAFGSCNEQNDPQVIWPTIAKHTPDLWIWLGDNIYGDTENMSVMAEKYAQQMSHEPYRAFISEHPIIGIWDDHDYGVNDGDKNYSMKEESKELMLDFLNVAPDAEVRDRPGAYQSYTLGPDGKQIKVILLDGRSFRDELSKGETPTGRGYLPNPEGDILGEAQWDWLEQQLENSEAEIHLIGCGIQFIPEEHRFEKWANFPAARKRLFDLMAEHDVSQPILISGDRHIAEISRLTVEGLEQPIYEVTASGMTHSYESVGNEPNRHRVGPIIGQKNFGLMRIDWSDGDSPSIQLEVRGIEGQEYIIQKVK